MTQKIQDKINFELEYADKNGSTTFSVCDHYNWDRDFWDNRHVMINEMRSRGYNVSVSVKWGVTDILISK